MRLAYVVFAAGCWTAGDAPPRAAAPAPEDGVPAREPFPLHSAWRGVYRCSQGLTAVFLELTAKPDGKLAAVFEFGPTPENPTVPTGAYRLAGTIRGGREGTFVVALEPHEWISEPDGYIMVPMSATSSRRWQRLVGKIDHPACGELDVRRAD